MDEKCSIMAWLSYLEGIGEWTMHIDSVFRFEENPEDLPAFL